MRLLNYCCCALLFLIPTLTVANTLKAQLNAGNLRWVNAYSISGGEQRFVPSSWSIVDNLIPADRWYPGALTSSSPNLLVLNSGNATVSVPFQVVGFEYNTGSAGPVEGSIESNGCPESAFSTGIVQVIGVACFHSRELINHSTVTPYSFIRPVIEIDTQGLKDAFVGKPEGIYRGTVNVGNQYDYIINNNDNIRTRQYSNETIILEVDYEPSFLSSVEIVGNSEIRPIYDLNVNKMSGDTIFNGVAHGWFSNGLKLSLNPGRTEYKMTGPASTQLPYSIECIGCEDNRLVENGKVINIQTNLPGEGVPTINFGIKVGYKDIDLDSVENGYYFDKFTLLFEPGI